MGNVDIVLEFDKGEFEFVVVKFFEELFVEVILFVEFEKDFGLVVEVFR